MGCVASCVNHCEVLHVSCKFSNSLMCFSKIEYCRWFTATFAAVASFGAGMTSFDRSWYDLSTGHSSVFSVTICNYHLHQGLV